MSAMRVTPAVFLLVHLLVYSTFPRAQQPAGRASDDTVHLRSNLVTLDVIVKDQRTGERVERLTQSDFEVFDDGKPVQITSFSNGSDIPTPLALIFAITLLDYNRTIAKSLYDSLDNTISQLRAQDKLAIIIYFAGLKVLQDFSSDKQAFLEALANIAENIPPRGKTINGKNKEDTSGKLLSHVMDTAIQLSSNLPPQYQVKLIAIDGDIYVADRKTVKQTALHLLANNITVNSLIRVDGFWENAIKTMPKMVPSYSLVYADRHLEYYSKQTGGDVIKITNIADYGAALEQVIGDISGRYSLGFIPADSKLDGRLHKLEVKVRHPPDGGRKRALVIQARKGYIAQKPLNRTNQD